MNGNKLRIVCLSCVPLIAYQLTREAYDGLAPQLHGPEPLMDYRPTYEVAVANTSASVTYSMPFRSPS